MTPVRAAYLVLILLIVVAAQAVAGAADDANQSEPKITLLEAGQEPRAELRVQPKAGDVTRRRVTMTMGMQQSFGGMKMPSTAIPPMWFDVQLTIKEVRDNGDIVYDFTYTDSGVNEQPGVMPHVRDSMMNQIKSMVGLKGEALATNRGITKRVDMQIPENVDPNVRQHIEGMREAFTQLGLPLPAEAIGVGAKWEVEADVTTSGMATRQKTIGTLTKIEGRELEIAVEMTQTADEQDIAAPGVPAGALRLVNLKSNGSGSIQMMLTEALPMRATMNLTSNSTMRINMEGAMDGQEMLQDMTMKMELGPAPTKPDHGEAGAAENGQR